MDFQKKNLQFGQRVKVVRSGSILLDGTFGTIT